MLRQSAKQPRPATRLETLQNATSALKLVKQQRNFDKKEAVLAALRPAGFDVLSEPDRLVRAVSMWNSGETGFTLNRIADIWKVEPKKLKRYCQNSLL